MGARVPMSVWGNVHNSSGTRSHHFQEGVTLSLDGQMSLSTQSGRYNSLPREYPECPPGTARRKDQRNETIWAPSADWGGLQRYRQNQAKLLPTNKCLFGRMTWSGLFLGADQCIRFT